MGDVLLVEGRSFWSWIIRAVTQSKWTHSALIVGNLDQLDPVAQASAHLYLKPDELKAPLIMESELGRGTAFSSILRYRGHHLRLCRPHGLHCDDAQRVIEYAIRQMHPDYNVRQARDLGLFLVLHQIQDLVRFLVPWWTIVPRRWPSSLFDHNHQDSTSLICSTLIARAFREVYFPVVPLVIFSGDKFRMLRRNSRLVAPRDFDYSPYFSVIKYPLLSGADLGGDDICDDIGDDIGAGLRAEICFYRKLPWVEHCSGYEERFQEELDNINAKWCAKKVESGKRA